MTQPMPAPASLPQVQAALQAQTKLTSQLLDEGNRLVVTLPCSLDSLEFIPGRTSRLTRLFWQQKTFLGSTGESGYLVWTENVQPLIQFITAYAYAPRQITPVYRPVLDALNARGLTSDIVQAPGGGYQIRVRLADMTYLTIGCPRLLPVRLEQVTAWRVEHYGPQQLIAVPYDSTTDANVYGSDINVMADMVSRYVNSFTIRYGGRHPLGVPSRHQRDLASPSTLAWLIEELAAVQPFDENEVGGGCISVADPDGSRSCTVQVPADVFARVSALLLSELTAWQTYGG